MDNLLLYKKIFTRKLVLASRLGLMTAAMLCLQSVQAQNTTAVPLGLYGPMYAAGTTIQNGGSIVVGAGGTWFLGGNITSADKGDPASPNATGRSEFISFTGTGTYGNAATVAGVKGNIINGYAGVTGKGTPFLLPVGGSDSVAYPFTTPVGANLNVAYFAGTGSSGTQTVSGITGPITIYTPFIELNVTGGIGGNNMVSWPATVAPSLGIDYLLAHIGAVTGDNNVNTFANAYQFGSSVYTGVANSAGSSFSLPPGITRIAFGSKSSVILPISLLSFTGIKTIGGNLLDWKVANAVQFSRFDVQRHTNAGPFITIGTVPYLSTATSFRYVDTGALGTNYYRLLMADLDGTVLYSNTVVITGKPGSFTLNGIYPTPAKNTITVATYSPVATNAIYTITDMAGRKVMMEKHTIQQVTKQALDVSNLPGGTYLLSVNVEGVVNVQTFVKQ